MARDLVSNLVEALADVSRDVFILPGYDGEITALKPLQDIARRLVIERPDLSIEAIHLAARASQLSARPSLGHFANRRRQVKATADDTFLFVAQEIVNRDGHKDAKVAAVILDAIVPARLADANKGGYADRKDSFYENLSGIWNTCYRELAAKNPTAADQIRQRTLEATAPRQFGSPPVSEESIESIKREDPSVPRLFWIAKDVAPAFCFVRFVA